MTEQKAIELASQFQRDSGRTTKVSTVRRIGQDMIDAMEEAHGKTDLSDCPDWMKPFPHWAILFDRGLNSVPAHHVIVVYDDGSVAETPAL